MKFTFPNSALARYKKANREKHRKLFDTFRGFLSFTDFTRRLPINRTADKINTVGFIVDVQHLRRLAEREAFARRRQNVGCARCDIVEAVITERVGNRRSEISL